MRFIAVILSFYRTRKTRTNDFAMFLTAVFRFSQNDIEKREGRTPTVEITLGIHRDDCNL